MKDIYIYIKGGVATPELSAGIKESIPHLSNSGYKIHLTPLTELPPDNSDCMIIGDWKTLNGHEVKLKEKNCNILLYFFESLPYLDYKGNLYLGNNHWSEKAWVEFKGLIGNYDHIAFYEGGQENFVLENYPNLEGKTQTFFLGVHDSYLFRENPNPKYDFMHFGWSSFGTRRSSILTYLNNYFSIYPKWSSIEEERTNAFNESRYILNLSFYNQPRFPWIRLQFAITNKMALFSEGAYCEPAYNKEGKPSEIIPNKHYIELPFRDMFTMKGELENWLEKRDKLEQMVERNHMYFFKKYHMQDRLVKLFDGVFL